LKCAEKIRCFVEGVTLVGGTGLQLACESNLAISSVAQESGKMLETLDGGGFPR
jgi:hypothetical protein